MGAMSEPDAREQYLSFAMAAIQRATIDKLRQDNESLKDELYFESKFSASPIDNIAVKRIAQMQDEADSLTRKMVQIQLEQRRVKLAELEAKQLQNDLGERMGVIKVAGGITSATEKAIALHKEIQRNESRREQAHVKHNEAFTHCKQLRAQIDSLRRERLVFDGIHAKLQQHLKERKAEMAKTIGHTNKAFDQREKCLSEMAQLKVLTDKENRDFEKEWKHLGRIIEDDKRKREAMRQQEMEERQRKTQELLKSREDALAQRSGANRKDPKVKRHRADVIESIDRVQILGEAFHKIQSATGIQDIDELIDKFKAADDQNYTLFNYVNELNQEIAHLEGQVKAIEEEIEAAQKQEQRREHERIRMQQEVDARLRSTEDLASQYQRRLEAATVTVGDLKDGVHAIFHKFGCATPAVQELLGDGGLTEQNILQHLAVIEQRVNEILRVHVSSLRLSGHDGDHLKAPLGQNAPVLDMTEVRINPPSTNDGGYEDMEAAGMDLDPKPLGQQQLLAKVRNTLQKRLDEKAVYRMVPERQKRGTTSAGKPK